ncbi:MAG: hypothetical protein JWP55_3640 [Mycobacterium sp.]|jgi:hypothetical protein|nr:hypothetical protein [Mycobacterium sp.]
MTDVVMCNPLRTPVGRMDSRLLIVEHAAYLANVEQS